ncbi:PREDICTED: uncharacterized protein LOC106741127 isoform X1 [Dinoponera quadriceps]|uniref:Uncharacterized protein LOC106741127 isoform X1 n=1 Tax=Dinoponera quadriceps TaxID=609295 RepID=A0A6P3WQF9_DINQU|nr:PREDICTED: uncharacterized protein LOC106741127 isoform X1 [Dinoponera quadriceps]
MVAAVSDVGLQVLRFMNFAPRSPGTFSEGLSRLFGVAHTDLNRQEKLLLARDPEAAFRIRPRRALRFTVLPSPGKRHLGVLPRGALRVLQGSAIGSDERPGEIVCRAVSARRVVWLRPRLVNVVHVHSRAHVALSSLSDMGDRRRPTS